MAKIDIYRLKGYVKDHGLHNAKGWTPAHEAALFDSMQKANLGRLFSPDSVERIHVPMYSRPGKGLHFSGGHQIWDWEPYDPAH